MISNIGITKRAHISRRKFDTIFDCFVADITSLQTSKIAHVNRNTSDRYFKLIREAIYSSALEERKQAELGNGIEVDESYFGPTRVRGKRGRGAGGKILVMGLLKRNGNVYSQIIKNASEKELLPIIRRTIRSGSDIYTDGWKGYNALAIYGYNHKKVLHSKDEFVNQSEDHINGIESYWSWTKRRLSKFNGVKKSELGKYLLESEWRFNHRLDLRKDLKEMLRKFKVN